MQQAGYLPFACNFAQERRLGFQILMIRSFSSKTLFTGHYFQPYMGQPFSAHVSETKTQTNVPP